MLNPNEFFKTLVAELKRNPLETFGAFILLFLLILVWQQSNAVAQILTPKQHTPEQLEQTLKTSTKIQDVLELMKRDLGGEVEIVQFHNGSYDLSGLPFTQLKVTYSTAKVSFDSKPISTMNEVLSVMWEDVRRPKCLLTDNVYRCPLVNSLDYPIGFVAVTFSEAPGNIQPYLEDKSLRIGGYLERS